MTRPPLSEVSPMILGVSRRDLLKDVLALFGTSVPIAFLLCLSPADFLPSAVKSRHLVKLGMDWQEIVRRAVGAERERAEE